VRSWEGWIDGLEGFWKNGKQAGNSLLKRRVDSSRGFVLCVYPRRLVVAVVESQTYPRVHRKNKVFIVIVGTQAITIESTQDRALRMRPWRPVSLGSVQRCEYLMLIRASESLPYGICLNPSRDDSTPSVKLTEEKL
jgi:hypothetical protein